MYRVVTIGREFGSGGAAIARKLAARLGWRLLDSDLIHEIASSADVSPEIATRFDEILDPWLHRLRKSLWQGGFEGVVTVTEAGFDAEAEARIAHRLIEEAAAIGECVIVGRGAQCILQKRPGTFHIFIYAPMKEKLKRVRERLGEVSATRELVEATERKRAAYVRRHFGQDWTNPHLYHLMVCSAIGEDQVVSLIQCALEAEARG